MPKVNPDYDPMDPYGGSPYLDERPTGGDVSLWDSAKGVLSGAQSALSDQAANAQAAFESGDSPNAAAIANYFRTTLGIGSEETQESMSPDAIRLMSSEVTSPEFWDHPLIAAGLKASNMAPSLAIAMAPALLSEGTLAPLMVAGIGGAQGSGASINDVYKQIEAKSDEDLRKTMPAYDGMRLQGRSEKDARVELAKQLRDFKPLLNAIVTGGSMLLGPAGKVAKLGSSAGKGAIGRFVGGTLEGGAGGLAMGATGEATHEQTAVELGDMKGLDPDKILAAGVNTGLEMGALSGVTGVLFPHGGHAEQVDAKGPDAAQKAALAALNPGSEGVTPPGKEGPLPPDVASKTQELSDKLAQRQQGPTSAVVPPDVVDQAGALSERLAQRQQGPTSAVPDTSAPGGISPDIADRANALLRPGGPSTPLPDPNAPGGVSPELAGRANALLRPGGPTSDLIAPGTPAGPLPMAVASRAADLAGRMQRGPTSDLVRPSTEAPVGALDREFPVVKPGAAVAAAPVVEAKNKGEEIKQAVAAKTGDGALREDKASLEEQAKQLVLGQRDAVFYPDTPAVKGQPAAKGKPFVRAEKAKPTAPEPPVDAEGKPLAHIGVDRAHGGTWHFDTRKTNIQKIRKKPVGESLKMGPVDKAEVAERVLNKGEQPTVTREVTPGGVIVKETLGTTETAPAQEAALQKAAPAENHVETVSGEQGVADRLNADKGTPKVVVGEQVKETKETKGAKGEAAKAKNRKSTATKKSTPEGVAKVTAEADALIKETLAEEADRAKWRDSQENPDLRLRIGGTEDSYAKYRKDARAKEKPATTETTGKNDGRGTKQAGKGANYTKKNRLDRKHVNDTADKIIAANPPKEGGETIADAVERARKLVAAVDAAVKASDEAVAGKTKKERAAIAEFRLPDAVRDTGDKTMQHNAAAKLLVEARDLLRKENPTQAEAVEFIKRDLDLRSGDEKAIQAATEARREKGDIERKTAASSNVEQAADATEAAGGNSTVGARATNESAEVSADNKKAALQGISQDLDRLSHEDEKPGDVMTGDYKYVSFDHAVDAVTAAVEHGMQPWPAQLSLQLGLAIRDADRILKEVKKRQDEVTRKGNEPVEYVKETPEQEAVRRDKDFAELQKIDPTITREIYDQRVASGKQLLAEMQKANEADIKADAQARAEASDALSLRYQAAKLREPNLTREEFDKRQPKVVRSKVQVNAPKKNTTVSVKKASGGEDELSVKFPVQLSDLKIFQSGTLKTMLQMTRDGLKHDSFFPLKGVIDRVINVMMKTVPNTQVHIVDRASMDKLAPPKSPTNKAGGLWTTSDQDGSHHIFIAEDQLGDRNKLARLIIHEGGHSVMADSMDRSRALYNIVDQMMRETAAFTSEPLGKEARRYAFTNPHEFMSEALSDENTKLQAAITPASANLRRKLNIHGFGTIKDVIKKLVGRVFGLSDKASNNVLERLIGVYEQVASDVRAEGQPTGPKLNYRDVNEPRARMVGPRDHVNEAFQERFTDALERKGQDAKSFVNQFTQKGKMVENAVRAGRSSSQAGKALLNKVTALGQIVGANEHDMPHLRGIWEANEHTGVLSRDLQEHGTEVAGMMIRAQKQNPALFERFSNLVQRETLAGVDASAPLGEGLNSHLGISKKLEARLAKGESMWDLEPEVATSAWRGRHAHADLKKEYDAIVAEDPRYAMMHEERQKFYSTSKAGELADMVDNIIDTFGFRGTEAERYAAAEKVMNGTMNKDEQAELATKLGEDDGGGKEAVKALMNARALRRVRGPYEPQMRRGDHAVVGIFKVKEPTNGTKIDDNTWEFKTRKEAHRFAVDSGLENSVKHVYYDPVTGKQVGTAVDAESTEGSAETRYRVVLDRQYLRFHENINDAHAELTDMGNSGEMQHVALEERANLLGANSSLDTQGIKALLKSLEQQEKYKNASENERKVLRNAIEEAGLRNLTGNRVQSRRIARKGTAGASTDAIRNMIDYNTSQANFRARMKTRGEISRGIEAMRADNKARRYGGDVDAALRRSQVANEVERRVMDPDLDEGTGRWSRISRRMSTWSYMDRMLRPAHLILHQMHLPMISSPYMGGRHGFMPAYAETMKAWKELTSFYKHGGEDAWASIVNSAIRKGTDYGELHNILIKDAPDAARLKSLHAELARTGITHPQAGIEVAKYQPANQLGGAMGALDAGMQRADTIFRGVTNATEAINRMAGANAAYRLEFRKLTRAGKSEADAHDLAVKYTKKVIHDTQGVYSNTNAPPIFQNKILKPFLQFKQFPQMMYHLLGSLTKTALGKGANYDGSKVSKIEQMQAIKSLAGILTTHALMAGAITGTPQEPLKVLVTVAHGLGLTDKDWVDFENAERGAIKSALGEEAGRFFINGLGAEAFGVDVRHRLGMGSLTTWGMPSSLDSKTSSEFLMNAVAGAPGSLATDAFKGVSKMLHGDLEEGALQAFPLQALRDFRNAVAPPKRKYDYTPSSVDPLKSLLGFTPSGKAEAIETQNAVYEGTHKYQDQRSAFSKQWVDSPESRDAIWQKIEAWNAGLPPEAKLTKGDLFKAQHAANRSMSYNRVIGGVTTTPHTKGIAQGLVDLYK